MQFGCTDIGDGGGDGSNGDGGDCDGCRGDNGDGVANALATELYTWKAHCI